DRHYHWRLENDASTHALYAILNPDLPLTLEGPENESWSLVAAYPGAHRIKVLYEAPNEGLGFTEEVEQVYEQVVTGTAHTDLHAELAAAAAEHPPSEVIQWTTWDVVTWKFPLLGDSNYIFDFKRRWVTAYQGAINAAAARFDLPPLLVAGVAYNEVGGDPQWIDNVAYGIRSFDHLADPLLEPLTITRPPRLTSFGNVSMQIRRAAETLGYNPADLTSGQEDLIIASLEDAQTNIFIAAAHLAQLRDIDFPGVGAAQLTDDQIAVVATRFNRGPDLSLERIRQNLSYGRAILRRRTEVEGLITPPAGR
ncbi:MAG TPA: hypothetical protein VGM86_08815, partial [Thermoanaerobaculia bacterium]